MTEQDDSEGAAPGSNEQDTGRQPREFGATLLDQVFRIWVEPAVSERVLNLTRSEIVRALVVLAPSDIPRVSINGDVELIALFRAARAIEAGEAVTLGDISGIEGLRPANIDANAGWLALAKIGNEIIVDFDFRRNRQTAALLVSLAVEFAEAATSSFDRGHLGPAIENAFAAVELAVKAQMFLLQDNPTQAHLERVAWWSQWGKLGNAPSGAAQVLQQLYGERGASRYGDRPISMAPDDVRAALEGVAGIIGLARARNAERETPT